MSFSNPAKDQAAPLTIGVLAMQGAFIEHVQLLESVHTEAGPVKARLVKKAADLEGLDGIILPGGESTAMAKLLHSFELMTPLRECIAAGLPAWGTCAGMILLAKAIDGGEAPHLGLMDITVKRNAYGRQVASFKYVTEIPEVADHPLPLVFIRAPYAVSYDEQVQLLKAVDGKPVALRQNHLLATAFHPELTECNAFHQYFVDMVQGTA